jgi:hypothetical protein
VAVGLRLRLLATAHPLANPAGAAAASTGVRESCATTTAQLLHRGRAAAEALP